MIRVELFWLTQALEDHTGMAEYFLNRETGKVGMLTDDFGRGLMDEDEADYPENDANKELRADARALCRDLEEKPGLWVEIRPLHSSRVFEFMEDFVAERPEGEAKRTLERALAGKKPFSHFKWALDEMPEVRKQWFAFQEECMRCHAERWLHGEGIEAELY